MDHYNIHIIITGIYLILLSSYYADEDYLYRQALTEAQIAGRNIYNNGVGINEILAEVGGNKLPAGVIPCIQCHGPEGSGVVVDDILPSKINWSTLTQGAESKSRLRSGYKEGTLKRAITMGIDASGNPLHVKMPRYIMSLDDMKNLIAYLKILGKESQHTQK